MFVLAKLFLLLALPGNALVILLAASAVLIFWRGERVPRIGRALVALLALAALAVAATALPDRLLAPLENRFSPPASLPERIEGIVVLGGSIDELVSEARGQVALTQAAARLSETVALARRYPDARILFSGGSGRLFPGKLSEAVLAERFVTALGIDAARLTLEDRSRNTYENALFSQRLVHPMPGERWLLVTSAAHMPRAVGVFRQAGWNVIPYPVDYRTMAEGNSSRGFDFAGSLEVLDDAAREWMGLLAYRLLGRTRELVPAP
jgi:uncharacterized SAM-binding protein YcdF (DUF218 family)